MVIFKSKCKEYDKILKGLYRYLGAGQVIYLSPEGEYYQANLVDVTSGNVASREIVLRVEGYRKLVCTADDEHSCTVIGGVKIETQFIKLQVKYSQLQKPSTLNERTRLYCDLGTVYFLGYDHPLCLQYDNTTLVKGPTQKFFASQMREKNLKSQ
jgi:hypothetical protein